METEAQNQEIAVAAKRPLLLEVMAAQYGMEAAAFKAVLLKTVFPQDKQVSLEQLAMFCIVAHKYALNPLTREIYAFPAKGGGIVPIVGYDGWISLLQRQEDYDGCEYAYIWKDDKVGGECLGVTCIIYRRKHSRPTKKTVWMQECKRNTDQWSLKPVWMLEIKALIQAARLAYGFGGIYDPDEGERIVEAQMKETSPGNFQSEISMPKRVEQIAPTSKVTPEVFVALSPEQQRSTLVKPVAIVETEPLVTKAEDVVLIDDPQQDQPRLQNLELQSLFDAGLVQKGVQDLRSQDLRIGSGRAKRLYAILNKAQIHTEAELNDEFLKPLKLEHCSDLPADIYERVCAWADGKLEDRG